MFIFKVYKSNDVNYDDFQSAVNCTKSCIESVLYDYSISVAISGDVIKICPVNVDILNLTFSECKEKIKGCFCDSHGIIYPEFSRIEPQQ